MGGLGPDNEGIVGLDGECSGETHGFQLILNHSSRRPREEPTRPNFPRRQNGGSRRRGA